VNKAWWFALVTALVVTSVAAGSPPVGAENQGSVKEFELALPEGIEDARRVVLELSEVRLPRNRAVVFRARAIDENGAEAPLGSVGMLAESNEAEGTVLYPSLRIDITKALKRWCQGHPGVTALRIRVVPYAGKEVLATLEWSAGAADVKVVAP
jgi:hypothetical protein